MLGALGLAGQALAQDLPTGRDVRVELIRPEAAAEQGAVVERPQGRRITVRILPPAAGAGPAPALGVVGRDVRVELIRPEEAPEQGAVVERPQGQQITIHILPPAPGAEPAPALGVVGRDVRVELIRPEEEAEQGAVVERPRGRRITVRILPPAVPAAPGLEALALSAATIQGGLPAEGVVRLDGIAPDGGVEVVLASDDAAARVPMGVTIAAGAREARFAVETRPVEGPREAAITATLAGDAAAARLEITPPRRIARQPLPDLVSFRLLRVVKKGGRAGDNTLPFLLSDVEEVIGGIASATCLVPATVPAGGFVSDVAIDIDAVTTACRVSTNIGTATEAIRITREGAASARVNGQNGWVASIEMLIDATPTVFTATLGGAAFEIDATLTVDAGTLDIRVAVADLRRR